MTNKKPETSIVDEGMVILIAIIAVIFTISLQILFFRKATFFEILIGSFTVFGVVYIIARYVFCRYSKKIRELMKRPVEIKWLLLAIFIAIAIIPLVVISTYNYYTKGIEGKIKYIFPDGSVGIFDLSERDELRSIFPQLAKIPLCTTKTYAANGKANSEFINNAILDGRKYYTKITFQNYFNSTDSNSGWMIICPLQSYDATEFTHLSFRVAGVKGKEKFGIKMKDTEGTEVGVEVMEFLDNKEVSTSWQEVIIPLERFRPVKMSILSVISLYSNGKLSHKGSETIYVTDFELY